MRPTAEDVDDLEELGLVRTETPKNTKRVFSLTVRGRRQAAALANPAGSRVQTGQAPDLDKTLRWLAAVERESPEALAEPSSLPERAVGAGLIETGSEEVFAQRIIDLLSQDFLTGDAPSFEQASSMARLQLADGLRLTMKAHDRLSADAGAAASLNFYGSVVAGQISAGDISNFVSFGDLLDRAEEALRDLENVSDEDRDGALVLIDVLRGRASRVGAQILTGAGGGLLADVLAQLVGLSPPA